MYSGSSHLTSVTRLYKTMIADDIEGFLKYLENVTFQLTCMLNVDGSKKQIQATKRSSNLTGGKRSRHGKSKLPSSPVDFHARESKRRLGDSQINGSDRLTKSNSRKLKSKRKARTIRPDGASVDNDLLHDLNVPVLPVSSSIIDRTPTSDVLIDIESKPQLSNHIEHGIHLTSNGITPVTLSDLTSGTNSLILNDGVGQLGICSDELTPLDPHASSISPLESTLVQFHSSIHHHHHHQQQNQHAHYFAMPRSHIDSYVQLQEDFSGQDNLPISSLNQLPVSPNHHQLQDNSRSTLCQVHPQSQQNQQQTSSSNQSCYNHQHQLQTSITDPPTQSINQLSHQNHTNHLRNQHHQSSLLIHINQHSMNANQLDQHDLSEADRNTTTSNDAGQSNANTSTSLHDQTSQYQPQLDQHWLSSVSINHNADTSLIHPSDPINLDHVVPLSPATHQSLEQVQFSAPLYTHQSYYAVPGDQLESFHISASDEFTSSSSSPISAAHQRQTIQGQGGQQHRSQQSQTPQQPGRQLSASETPNSSATYEVNHSHRTQNHQIQEHHHIHHHIGQQQVHYLGQHHNPHSHSHHNSHQQLHQQQIQGQSMHQHYHHNHHLDHQTSHILPVMNGLEPVNGVILQDINLASATWSSPEDLYSI